MVKKVLLIVTAVMCCVVVWTAGAYCSTMHDTSICSEVQLVVEDSLERQYVSEEELLGYLRVKGIYAQGQMMDEIDCHEIEQYLLEHEMVRDALCYKSPFGGLYIRVTQRIPELLVVTHDARYYVDSDRRVMPIRRQIDVDVPVVRGAVNERAAREDYYDFAMWLKEDRYWRDVISEVYVHSPKYLVLTQKDDHAKIVLGTMDGYAEKLAKLHKLYTRGLSEIEHPVYKEYDLRFEGQVVARK